MVSDGSFAWIEHIHNTHTQFSHSHGYHTYAEHYSVSSIQFDEIRMRYDRSSTMLALLVQQFRIF